VKNIGEDYMEEKQKKSAESYDRCMCVCHDKAEHNKKRKKTCEREIIMTRTAACKNGL